MPTDPTRQTGADRGQPGPRPRSRGRRAGGQGAREQILVAARAEFVERGYERASLRGVARRAAVDPALVRYYFRGGKGEPVARPGSSAAGRP